MTKEATYLKTVNDYFARGMQLVPVNEKKIPAAWTQDDGTKTHSWKIDIPKRAILEHKGWIALAAGKRSGNVECIDVDLKYDLTGDLWDRYKQMIIDHNESLYNVLVINKTTNKGIHILYRSESVEGNLKLASRETNDVERFQNQHEKRKVLLETRGEGGYFLVPPSEGYETIQGDMMSMPMLSKSQRNFLIEAARSFDLLPKKEVAPAPPKDPLPKVAVAPSYGQGFGSSVPPGEDYGNRGDVIALLQRHGWTEAFISKGQHFMTRPGKTGKDYGATYSHEKRSFYVFTSSSEFEQGESYSPMGVYAVLETNGNFEEAARRLGKEGYGDSSHTSRSTTSPKKTQQPEKEISATDYMYGIEDGDDLLYSTARGTLPLGQKFGVATLDKHLRYKKNQYLLVVGNQNVGKTFVVLFMLTKLAMKHGMKFLVLVMENDVGQAKRDISQFFIEEIIKRGSDETLIKKGLDFVNKHFRFLHTTKFRFDHKEALSAGAKIHKEWPYDGFFIDPYNALKMNLSGSGFSGYEYHLEASNEIQFFSKSVVSVILSCHVTSEAARRGSMPRLDDVQGGMSFTAKAHDGIVIHREVGDKELKYITDIGVSKIKDKQTGGDWTDYGNPIKLKLSIQPKFGFIEEGDLMWFGDNNIHDDLGQIDAAPF